MPHYIALIHEAGKSSYRIAFPDFPDCDAAGKTPEEAWLLARKALSTRIEHLRSEGRKLPPPSPLSAVSKLNAPGLHDIFSVRI
ncbi:MAG: type II toxin-antitoxin system HicB family antitoxin [Sulfuricellaceae bacterium]|jgi:predicted RNase H-like HicB family nuclease